MIPTKRVFIIITVSDLFSIILWFVYFACNLHLQNFFFCFTVSPHINKNKTLPVASVLNKRDLANLPKIFRTRMKVDLQ